MIRTGEALVTDGEQRASSFATYSILDSLGGSGLASNLVADGQYFAIFDDGHHRQLPRLTKGPLKYQTYAYENFKKSMPYAEGHGMKQAVIAPSMLYLLYPLEGEVEGYTREEFVEDLVNEVHPLSTKIVLSYTIERVQSTQLLELTCVAESVKKTSEAASKPAPKESPSTSQKGWILPETHPTRSPHPVTNTHIQTPKLEKRLSK